MASHFFQESLFKMGPMIPISEEVLNDNVVEAFIISALQESIEATVEKNRQLMLSLDEKVRTNALLTQKEEEE